MQENKFLDKFKGMPLKCKDCKKSFEDDDNKLMIGATKGTCKICQELKEVTKSS